MRKWSLPHRRTPRVPRLPGFWAFRVLGLEGSGLSRVLGLLGLSRVLGLLGLSRVLGLLGLSRVLGLLGLSRVLGLLGL